MFQVADTFGLLGTSFNRLNAFAAAAFASWPPFAISSAKRCLSISTALAFACVTAASSAFAVPVGGRLPHRLGFLRISLGELEPPDVLVLHASATLALFLRIGLALLKRKFAPKPNG